MPGVVRAGVRARRRQRRLALPAGTYLPPHVSCNYHNSAKPTCPNTLYGGSRCLQPNDAPWHSAYHGLVRGVIRVSSVAGRDPAERALLRQIDVSGPMSSAAAPLSLSLSTYPIVVEASADGFEAVTITIPVSTDAAVNGVNAVATAAAGKPVDFFANDHN